MLFASAGISRFNHMCERRIKQTPSVLHCDTEAQVAREMLVTRSALIRSPRLLTTAPRRHSLQSRQVKVRMRVESSDLPMGTPAPAFSV